MSRTLTETLTPATLTVEPLLKTDELAGFFNAGRRRVECIRSARILPRPDLFVGMMPRWKAETIRRWVEGRGVGAA